MTNMTFRDSAYVYIRFSKRDVISLLWSADIPFYMIACKTRPGFPFSMGMIIDPKHEKANGRTFQQVVDSFADYNCSWEGGRYPAYYSLTPL